MKRRSVIYAVYSVVLLMLSCIQERYCEVESIETIVQENKVSVNISAESTSDIVQYNWSFSDGFTKATIVPHTEHTFTESGNHTVEVEVEDSEGNICYYESGFRIDNTLAADTCDIDVSFFEQDGSLIELMIESNGELEGATITWETGDGYEVVNDLNQFEYKYDSPGSYDLKVTYEYGECIDSTVRVIHLHDSLFDDCDLPYEADKQVTGTEVVFESSVSLPNNEVKYFWDMGDGSPVKYTYGPEFYHDYSSSGTYEVNVTMELEDCENQIEFVLIIP